ncbi:MAG: hypothetical protein GYA86_05230 [Firmicutes bacterium]|nr:hypothetical protein [Bacillota bacterium]
MRLKSGKYILVTVLALALLLNPVAGMAGTVAASAGGGAAAGAAASKSPFRQSASLLGTMFDPNSQTFAGPSEENKESILGPLLGTVEEYLKLLLEDERLREVLGEVLDEIMADERIANYDLEALVVGTLRDDRLTEILGSVIAQHLREDDFLQFVEQITFDLAALLQDPSIVSYLQKVVVSLLEDDRINEFVFEIVYYVMAHLDRFIENVGEGELIEAITGFAEKLIEIFEQPVMDFAEGVKDDRRVTGYLDRVQASLGLDKWEDIGGWFVDRLGDNLDADTRFEQAVADLKALLLGPEDPDEDEDSGVIARIAGQITDYILDQDTLIDLVKPLLDELTDIGGIPEEGKPYKGAYPELFKVLLGVSGGDEGLLGDLKEGLLGDDGVLTAIGAEFESIMDHYSEYAPFPEESDPSGCMEDIQGEVTNQEAVEDHVAAFLNYWAEVAAWVAGKKIERGDLEPLLEKFTAGEDGEDDGEYAKSLATILEAVSASVEDLEDSLPGDLEGILKGHLEGFTDELESFLKDLLDGEGGLLDEVAPVMKAIITEKLEVLIDSGELTELLEGKGDVLLEVLLGLLTGLFEDLDLDLGLDQANGGGVQEILDNIALELPFAALTDLIDTNEVRKLIGELAALIDSLPLEEVVPFVRDNSDELGYTIAETLLNGLADGVENPEPDDPRVAVVMELLLTEERLRQLYLDLGGIDPDKVTDESGVLTVILAVLLEVAGDETRIEHFRAKMAGESEPVVENLLDYGKKFSDWLLGSLRSFAGPFIKRALASFLLFTPRGYSDELEGEPADWISYERFADDAAEGRQLAGEILTRSMAARFVDESISSFLVEHRAVEDFATPQRLGVLQHFIAEIAGAEQLKSINAQISAEKIFELVGTGLPRLQGETLPALIKPDSLTRDLNAILAELLPSAPIHLSLESFSLNAGEILGKVTGFIDEKLPLLRKEVDGMARPLGNLPAGLLDDEAIRKAKDEILAGIPRPALDLVAEILDDERMEELLADVIEKVIGKVMADEGIMDSAFKLAGDIVSDPELKSTVEEAMVTILTGHDLPLLLGDLVGDLLEDEALLTFVEELLDTSRMIAVGGYSCPSNNEFYKPKQFLGSDSNGNYPLHGFEGEEDLPAPFEFETQTVKIEMLNLSVQADYFFFEMGCNNGLYMFTQELLNWMDPGKAFNPDYPTPGSYLRSYLPQVYLAENRVRDNIAKPVTALILGTVAGTIGDLSGERQWIEDFLLNGEGLPLEPLQIVAQFLKEDANLPGIIGSCFKLLEEPYNSMTKVLNNNVEIEGLIKEAFAALPLEEGAAYLKDNRALEGLLDDTGIDIDLAPLQPLLKIDRELPRALLRRAQTFPASRVTNFLTVKERLYRTTYMVEDVKARFMTELLTDPDLIRLESDLAREKVQEANYSLAEGVFNVSEKFVNNGDLIDHLGKMVFDFIGEQFKKAKKLIRFLFGRPGDGPERALAPALPGPAGLDRRSGVLWTKEVA